MTRPSPQKLSALHRRRAFHPPRAETPTTKVLDATPTPKTTAAASVVDRPRDRTRATPENPSSTSTVLPLIPNISLPPLLGLVTPSLTSTISTTAVSTTPSVTTSSLSSTPPITTATSHITVQTTTRFSSSARTTSTAAVRASSGLSTATLIGGIGGALGGTILLTVMIAFFLRRWRRKQAIKNAFDASQFRRTSTLLHEEKDNTPGRPRPPTMIERRNVIPTTGAASFSSPSAAYPYSDQPPVLSSFSGNERSQSFAQHGANQVQYGAIASQSPYLAAGNQFGGAPNAPTTPNPYIGQGDPFASYSTQGQGHEQPGYGAPPIPGTHGPGAYAPYGARYPQYQLHQQQHQHQQYPRFGQGLAVDAASGDSLTREASVSSLVNPFAPLPVPTNLRPTEGSGSISTSTSSSSNAELTRGASFVTRQSQEAPPPAYPTDRVYTDMKKDIKVSPSTSSSLKVVNGSSDSAVPATKSVDTTTTSKESAPEPRPVSAYTLYNADDAYGGM